MSSETTLHIIYLESRMLLSKKRYSGWRAIQDEFPDYKASLGPWPVTEVLAFLSAEYPNRSPFTDEQIRSFSNSKNETIAYQHDASL